MRYTLLLLALIAVAAAAQAQDTLPIPIDGLTSPNWEQRSSTLDHILEWDATLSNAQIQSALLATLKSENELIVVALRQSGGVGLSGQYGEGYSEFYAKLL